MTSPRGADAAAAPMVAVFADESCLGNGRALTTLGGAAGLIEYRHPGTGRLARRDFWVSAPHTTNNQMALRSVMEAFRGLAQSRIPLRVVFTSDSLYLIKGLGEWVHGWAGHEWTRPRHGGSSRARSPIENVALWREAVRIIRDAGHAYEWRWVRGHDGHAQNEYANFLAMRAAADQTTSDGLAPSGFAAWLAAKRARRGGIGAPADFPDGATFRPARPLPEP